ncbi:hypothetical protein GCM10020254_83140 [Streptomyces goshikiensis]
MTARGELSGEDPPQFLRVPLVLVAHDVAFLSSRSAMAATIGRPVSGSIQAHWPELLHSRNHH